MINSIFMTVLCVFAVYGAVKLVFYLYGYFSVIKGEENIKRHTVLFFENNQDEVEVVIREIVLNHNPFCGEIIAVDSGSTDETLMILRRLEKEYDILQVMNMENYIEFIKG